MNSPIRRHTHLRCEAGCLRDQQEPLLQRRSSDTPSSSLPQCPKTPHKKRLGGSLASSPVRRARAGVAETLVKEAGTLRGGIRETLVRDAGHSLGEVRETLHLIISQGISSGEGDPACSLREEIKRHSDPDSAASAEDPAEEEIGPQPCVEPGAQKRTVIAESHCQIYCYY